MKVRRTSPELRIEIMPLVDVVFLLLTFFVFSLTLMIRADVLNIDLPELSSGQTAESRINITVSVGADGTLAIDGEIIEIGNLVSTVKGALEDYPEARLLIAADTGGTVGELMNVYDVLVNADIREFSIAVNPTDAPNTSNAPADQDQPPR